MSFEKDKMESEFSWDRGLVVLGLVSHDDLSFLGDAKMKRNINEHRQEAKRTRISYI